MGINIFNDDFTEFLEAFSKFGMSMYDLTLETFLDTENFDVFEFGRSPVAIDIITKLKGITFDEAYNSRIRFQLHESLSINVIHINTLIKSKIAAGRAKDINDIEHLKNKN